MGKWGEWKLCSIWSCTQCEQIHFLGSRMLSLFKWLVSVPVKRIINLHVTSLIDINWWSLHQSYLKFHEAYALIYQTLLMITEVPWCQFKKFSCCWVSTQRSMCSALGCASSYHSWQPIVVNNGSSVKQGMPEKYWTRHLCYCNMGICHLAPCAVQSITQIDLGTSRCLFSQPMRWFFLLERLPDLPCALLLELMNAMNFSGFLSFVFLLSFIGSPYNPC